MDVKETSMVDKKSTPTLIKVLSFTADKATELCSVNSVVGEKIEADGITVIPISKISVGFAGGGADMNDNAKRKNQNPAGAGAKVSLTPLSFLVIRGNDVRVMSVEANKNSPLADILPFIIDKAKALFASKKK